MDYAEMNASIPHLLKLDKTVLVFLPDIFPAVDELHIVNKKTEHRVAQVTLQTDGNGNYDVDTLAVFYTFQHEISDLVFKIVDAHQIRALPTPARFAGEHYSITADKQPWVYGKDLLLRWGKEKVKPCTDKWTFTFSVGA